MINFEKTISINNLIRVTHESYDDSEVTCFMDTSTGNYYYQERGKNYYYAHKENDEIYFVKGE